MQQKQGAFQEQGAQQEQGSQQGWHAETWGVDIMPGVKAEQGMPGGREQIS